MMNIEYDKIYKAPYHNNGGEVCGYKVDKSDLDNLLKMLRKAEQERDQYKAELESLRAKIKESQKEIVRMQGELYKSNMYNKDLHSEICGLRTKIKEAQEPIAEVHRHGKSGDYYLVELKNRAIYKGLKLYTAPVIPD